MTINQENMMNYLRKMAESSERAGLPDVAKKQREKADEIEKAGREEQ